MITTPLSQGKILGTSLELYFTMFMGYLEGSGDWGLFASAEDVISCSTIIAMVTLRTFALGKLDLLTVLPTEKGVTDFSPDKS